LGKGPCSPGRGFQKPEKVALPAIIALTSIAISNEPATAPVVKVEQVRCHACGQVLPEPIAPPVPAGPSSLTADWNDLERTDLPPRSSMEIQALIREGETEDARGRRIVNDKLRWLHQQER
jgi:hypothetical protein